MLVYDNFKRASSSKLINEIELNSSEIEAPILTINDSTLTQDQSIKIFTKNNKTNNELKENLKNQNNFFDFIKLKK